MASRRDFLKTTGGLALASGGTWMAGARATRRTRCSVRPSFPTGRLPHRCSTRCRGRCRSSRRAGGRRTTRRRSRYFNDVFTPNDAFFVRYHLSNIPEVAAATWRLKVGGDAAATPFELTLDELKRDFEQVEIAAVNQCSGNRRGLFEPHVPGVEWGLGAMGNARWKGAAEGRAGEGRRCKKEAVEIVFDGADAGVVPGTPDFVKSIPGLEGARREHAHRLRDERRAAAALERLSGAHRRARLDRRPTG